MRKLLLLSLIAFIVSCSPTAAHGIVGKRMFIEPVATEDANVKTELVLPNIAFLTLPDGTDRRRKVYAIEPAGRAAIAQAHNTWIRMTRGLKPKLESR